ncbi:MAG: DoxX family protein [Archangium sp.]|nr:DoxX family protein [Archangium sp.]
MKTDSAPAPGRGLQSGLWGAQLALAAVFFVAGLMKVTQPSSQLVDSIPWGAEVPAALVRFIGTFELLGAIGVIVPAATHLLPKLSGFAGVGLATLTALATGFHGMRGEYANLPLTLALCGLAAFVAWGRLLRAPISPRGMGRPAGPAARV